MSELLNSKGGFNYVIGFGYVNDVREIMRSGADVNVRDKNGNTVLHEVAMSGQSVVAQLFLEANAEVNATNDAGETPLMVAASNGFFNHTVDVDCSRHGFLKIIVLLLELGSDPNKADKLGNTALMLAAKVGEMRTVETLVLAGANVFATNKENLTALDCAINESSKSDPNIVKFLARKGVPISQKLIESASKYTLKYTPYIIYRSDYSIRCQKLADIVKLLPKILFHRNLRDMCMALAPLMLPPYVVLEIFNWLPQKKDANDLRKIRMIQGVMDSRKKVITCRK